MPHMGLPWWVSGLYYCQCRRHGFNPLVWKILWRRKWQPTPAFLPGESCGQRSTVHGVTKESDMTQGLNNNNNNNASQEDENTKNITMYNITVCVKSLDGFSHMSDNLNYALQNITLYTMQKRPLGEKTEVLDHQKAILDKKKKMIS